MEISIRPLEQRDFIRWNTFVTSSPDGTFFHLAEWKMVLEQAFGHKTHFIYAEYGGVIMGVLPLAELKSVLFGHHLISTPFCVYGGILAETEEVLVALQEAACQLADTLEVDALELRNSRYVQDDWPHKDLYVTFRKVIGPDNEENLKAIPRKQRAMVRKGINGGLVSHLTHDCGRLYRIYSESVRNLGTPVFSVRYFRILKKIFGNRANILMISMEGRDIAGVMSFYYRDQVLPYYGGSIAAARVIQGANDFMYWELLRRSAEEGCRLFDFGRSKIGTGPYSFKRNWGFSPEPLCYQYYLVKEKSVPNVNPTNPKYQLFVKAWKKLPLALANTAGPVFAKNLG